MIVEKVQFAHMQAGPPVTEVDLDGFVLHRNHPEYVVPVDVYVVVVDLCREARRSNRTGVQVKSNKGERASMLATVGADKSALAESHICLERQRHCVSRRSVCTRATSADVGQAHEPAEVCDLRRVVKIG